MKKVVAVLSLMLCLSLPAQGGHTMPGGVFCNCDDPNHVALTLPEDEPEIEQNEAPVYEVSDLDAFLDVLLIMLSF